MNNVPPPPGNGIWPRYYLGRLTRHALIIRELRVRGGFVNSKQYLWSGTTSRKAMSQILLNATLIR